MNRLPDAEVLLTPREVADLFGVDPKTVTRWAKAGKLLPFAHWVAIAVIANLKSMNFVKIISRHRTNSFLAL